MKYLKPGQTFNIGIEKLILPAAENGEKPPKQTYGVTVKIAGQTYGIRGVPGDTLLKMAEYICAQVDDD